PSLWQLLRHPVRSFVGQRRSVVQMMKKLFSPASFSARAGPMRRGRSRKVCPLYTLKADICSALAHVRFTPESGHVQCNSVCLLSDKSRHWGAQRERRTVAIIAAGKKVTAAGHPPQRSPYDRPNQGTNPGCPASRARRLADQTSLAVQQITDFAECALL